MVVIARHTQSTQNQNFAKSLQYLKKYGSDKVDFLHAEKHETFQFQVDGVNFSG